MTQSVALRSPSSGCGLRSHTAHSAIRCGCTVPVVVNSHKGVSSRRLRQWYRMRTHRDHLWSPSYFAAS